jgi:hypothetical protein
MGVPPIRDAPARLGPSSPLTAAHRAASESLGPLWRRSRTPFCTRHGDYSWHGPDHHRDFDGALCETSAWLGEFSGQDEPCAVPGSARLASGRAGRPGASGLLRGRASGRASASRPAHAADAAAGRNQLVARGRQTRGANHSISVRRRLRLCRPIGADPPSQRASNRRVRNRRNQRRRRPVHQSVVANVVLPRRRELSTVRALICPAAAVAEGSFDTYRRDPRLVGTQ